MTVTSILTAESTPAASGEDLLEVSDLQVEFYVRRGVVRAVRDVTFSIARGEVLGLVGESGSGKSVTSQAVMGLTELPGFITGGNVIWKGKHLVKDGKVTNALPKVRGKEISMVFQDPMTSLNPLFTIGDQLSEVTRRHLGMNKKQSRRRALEMLDLVGIANSARRLDQRPSELSGGMRQRVLIAMALLCEPELLVADEPTTALDVTIQAQILELLARLQSELGLSILLITHDLGVVAGMCDRVAVMYGGRIGEVGPADALFARPHHHYTAGLLDSTPRLDEPQHRLVSIPGSPPDLVTPPVGCPYAARCADADDTCLERLPELVDVSEGRSVACWHPIDLG